MKAAFAVWDDRIAPLFDVARHVHLVEADAGRIVAESETDLPVDVVARKVRRLADLGVGTLICGAISGPVQGVVAAFGIRLVPFVAGDLSEVVKAWLSGDLDGDRFAMPGCGGRRRRRTRGGRGRRTGRNAGPPATALGGECVCPRCGHRERHERGALCAKKPCPSCGTAMRRE
jgi:predicted Fe-Mo cluster-binding NifX family protein